MRCRILSLAAVAIVSVALGSAGRAEVFVLSSGGRLEGELLNRDEKPRQSYVIKLASGAQLTLEAAQVAEVLTGGADQSEYAKVRPQYPDTAQGQWQLAEWCREHQFPAERKVHLARVIQLDPNHLEARHALGYSQVDGKWTTREEAMSKQGLVLYKGRYRTQQEIELIENRRKQELAEKDWFQKLKRWRNDLGGNKNRAARDNIANIDDPLAVKALARYLGDDRDPERTLYIEPLARIDTPAAAEALAQTAIDDASEDVRLTCLEQLQKKPHPEVVQYFVKMLGDKNNVIVNRAAVGLAHMKDRSAVPALIQALVTRHKQKIGNGNPGQMTTTFPTGGAGKPGSGAVGGPGMGMGMGGGPKIVSFPVPNQSVLDALVTLTGQNFNFDGQAWRTWYGLQKKSQTLDLDARRD
ncbi:MAG: HEAT repeat domain-containing protein [Thermoguttaceae bacterium]